MKCAVRNCKKTHGNKEGANPVRFFRFPRKTEQQEQWKTFCRRSNPINVQNERICSRHFRLEDFERNLRAEMGFSNRNALTLKPEAIPSLQNGHDGHLSNSVNNEGEVMYEKHILPTTNEYCIVKEEEHLPVISNEYCSIELEDYKLIGSNGYCSVKHENDIPVLPNETYITTNNVHTNANALHQQHIKSLEQEVIALRRENGNLKKLQSQSFRTINKLQRQVKSLSFCNSNVERVLSRIFTEGQIKKIKNGDVKRQNWTEADIAQSVALYSTSPKAYKLLKQKKFPLPSVRTVQRWSQK